MNDFNKIIFLDRVKVKPGDRYGKLVVIGFSHKEAYHLQWLCQCDCGNHSIVAGHLLRHNYTKSCGCTIKEANHKRLYKYGKTKEIDYDYYYEGGKRKLMHRKIAAKILGKPLPPKVVIHHYRDRSENYKIVICENQAYHMLLHKKIRKAAKTNRK